MARGRFRVVSRQMARATSVPSLASLSSLLLPSGSLSLPDIEDGRMWHPDPDQGALTIGGRFARVVVHSRPIVTRRNTLWSPRGLPAGVQVPVGVRFESPFKVITCLRRKVRRQVMFATGRGGGGKRRGRRTWRSNVSC